MARRSTSARVRRARASSHSRSAPTSAVAGGVTSPRGFRAASAEAGIKPGSRRPDLALVLSDAPAVVAGMFTTNRVQAAPVVWSRRIVARRGAVRAVLLNSGNANACTGPSGDAATRASAGAVARLLGVHTAEILVASTGVIGVPFPVERLLGALPALVGGLGSGRSAARGAARAILTTDTVLKERAARARVAGRDYTIGGVAKGAGMIHPDMATMLAVVTTDAPLGRAQARRLLRAAVDRTFNALTVDGDTSTNDCVLFLANGLAGGRIPPGSAAEDVLAQALESVCARLAEAIAADGEGARKLLIVRVEGARSDRDARHIARTVAASMLVKTAVHGGDPNWGRVLAAAGRAGVRIDPGVLDLWIGGALVARGGAAHPPGERAAARHLQGRRIVLDLCVGHGPGRAVGLGSDLSADYVRINAHYRS